MNLNWILNVSVINEQILLLFCNCWIYALFALLFYSLKPNKGSTGPVDSNWTTNNLFLSGWYLSCQHLPAILPSSIFGCLWLKGAKTIYTASLHFSALSFICVLLHLAFFQTDTYKALKMHLRPDLYPAVNGKGIKDHQLE